jgi:RNA polymerase sigma-70 factor (ECF subfamily)
MDDDDLIASARRGNDAAFCELVRRHQKKALAVALGIVRDPDDARDLCQEAFLRAVRGLGDFDGQAQFSTWLYRIVVNQCIDHLRRRRPDRVELDEGIAADGDLSELPPPSKRFDPARALERRELGHRIADALDRLSPAHRTVLVLREVQGLSYKEIAESMRCSIGTVMSRLFHARKKAQLLLAEYREVQSLAA